MTEKAYFFDAELVGGEPDRIYQSEAWSDVFGKFVRDGYIADVGTEFTVTASSGMTVNVGSGAAWIRGKYYENTDVKTLTLNPSDAFTRHDAVVLRLDYSDREITLEVKAGGSGGTLPTMQDNSAAFEVLLWDITVPAGALSITSGNVSSGSKLSSFGMAKGPEVRSQALPLTTTQRDALDPPPVSGQLIFNTTESLAQIYNGSTWNSVGIQPYHFDKFAPNDTVGFFTPLQEQSWTISVPSHYIGKSVVVSVLATADAMYNVAAQNFNNHSAFTMQIKSFVNGQTASQVARPVSLVHGDAGYQLVRQNSVAFGTCPSTLTIIHQLICNSSTTAVAAYNRYISGHIRLA